MIESAKAFFTGTLATIFYAVAAVTILKEVRENNQMRAVMRLTGLRCGTLKKAVGFRNEMDHHKVDWAILTTRPHFADPRRHEGGRRQHLLSAAQPEVFERQALNPLKGLQGVAPVRGDRAQV